MSDKVLYIALVVSVFGLLILAFASEVLEPPITRISGIGSGSVGKQVHVQGSVSKVTKFKGGSSLLVLSDKSGSITVYLDYSITKARPDVLKASVIDVIGEIDEYEGSLEIKPSNPNSIRIVS
jgi:DNA/RNA endonuclease YhcR with UshA esterase domain